MESGQEQSSSTNSISCETDYTVCTADDTLSRDRGPDSTAYWAKVLIPKMPDSYDKIWCDMIWYDMILYDIIWYDMIWYNVIWYDMIWYMI